MFSFENDPMFIILNENNNSLKKEIQLKELNMRHCGSKIRMNESSFIRNEEKESNLLFFQGELFNLQELFQMIGCSPISQEPYHEIILLLYRKYGFEDMLSLLNGVFRFALLDNNLYSDEYQLYVVNDCFSSTPLYLSIQKEYQYSVIYLHTFPIELENKHITCVVQPKRTLNEPFPPGSYCSFHLSHKVFSFWEENKTFYKYNHMPFQHYFLETVQSIKQLQNEIKKCIIKTVDRQVANKTFLLSSVLEYDQSTKYLVLLNKSGLDELLSNATNKTQVDLEYDIGIRNKMRTHPTKIIVENSPLDNANKITVFPFLDKTFIQYILSIDPLVRNKYRDTLILPVEYNEI